MQASVSYKEIQDYILREYKKEIGIRFIDPKTLRISYSPSRFLPIARINIRVDFISEEEIIISYHGNSGINLIIRGLVMYMDSRIDKSIVNIIPENKQVFIYPASVKSLSKALEYVTPADICFTEEGAVLSLAIR